MTIEPKPLGGPDSPLALRHVAALRAPGCRAVRRLDARPHRDAHAGAPRSGRSTSCAAAAGRVRPAVGVIPPTSVEGTREEALAHVNVPGLLAWANKSRFAVRPASGRFETASDLEGQLVAGTPDDVAAECRKFEALGLDQLVFDLRFRFDRWVEQVERLGTDVLPRLGAHLAVGGTTTR